MVAGVVENVLHVELFVDLSPRPFRFTVVHRDFAWKSVFRAGWLVLPEWCLEELMHHIYIYMVLPEWCSEEGYSPSVLSQLALKLK